MTRERPSDEGGTRAARVGGGDRGGRELERLTSVVGVAPMWGIRCDHIKYLQNIVSSSLNA